MPTALEKRAGLAPGSVKDLHRESIDGISFPSLNTPGGIEDLDILHVRYEQLATGAPVVSARTG